MHLLPWIRRQLRGESMGDGLSPKRPELSPLLEHPLIEQATQATVTHLPQAQLEQRTERRLPDNASAS